MTNTAAPSCKALLLPILVVSRVCMFSVNVVDPVPVPHTPAIKVEIPSSPIPLLTTPRVGGLKFTSSDAAWYDESCICTNMSMHARNQASKLPKYFFFTVADECLFC